MTVIGINSLLGFSFWHNGFYFIERKKIDGAYNGFKSNAGKGTAIFDFNYNTRSVMEIISWCLVVCYMCYLLDNPEFYRATKIKMKVGKSMQTYNIDIERGKNYGNDFSKIKNTLKYVSIEKTK